MLPSFDGMFSEIYIGVTQLKLKIQLLQQIVQLFFCCTNRQLNKINGL
ncbi:MAG: hypothetical protein CDV28_10835 [Candidatus Electronema aureum]|uniref:Uncharacterized protein n=1 Tax=Candidatus Electronema aureum TaxID=2005002 RepID=A0A521G2P5_9BACT|nr:MAG: hypothetical protein CDV28_10835 [Candidatus Electronema aureum]